MVKLVPRGESKGCGRPVKEAVAVDEDGDVELEVAGVDIGVAVSLNESLEAVDVVELSVGSADLIRRSALIDGPSRTTDP